MAKPSSFRFQVIRGGWNAHKPELALRIRNLDLRCPLPLQRKRHAGQGHALLVENLPKQITGLDLAVDNGRHGQCDREHEHGNESPPPREQSPVSR